jgi:hypothetical protein
MAKSTEFFKEICKYSREDFDRLLLEKGKHGKLPKVLFHISEDERKAYKEKKASEAREA